jgi:uncharacterized protein (TIGR02145 family)
MKTITKTAKLAFVAMLVIFCFACEEKEKAKEANMRDRLAELAAIEAAAEAEIAAQKTQAAAKSDTLYITETGYVQIWIPDEGYVDETGDGSFYMGNALGKVRELGLEGVSAAKDSYVSFALANGKQHIIKANDYSYDILLYKKGHEPVNLDLGSEMPITGEVYLYLGLAFTDSRDGKTYKTVVIGGKTWMAQNLNHETGNSWCYENSADNCNEYGRLYDWDTAKKTCPKGWHLPSVQEWKNLVATAGGNTAGTALKAKSGWHENGNGTDAFGFSALPGGTRTTIFFNYYDTTITFDFVGKQGFWWTSTPRDAEQAFSRSITYYNGGERVSSVDNFKYSGFSVRCVRD